MIGINISGAEFGGSGTRYDIDYHYPTASELAYYAQRGVELVRLPVKWERLQPTLGGELAPEELARLLKCIADAHALGMQVIVDVHNYGRYSGQTIGSAAVPIPMFADFWSKMAAALSGQPGVAGYDLMNEPHDMGGAGIWKSAAQAAVDAIRKIDMAKPIYVEGDAWSSAHTWLKYNSDLIINDPANKIIYQAHVYFDKTNQGIYANSYDADGTYPDIGVDRLKPFVEWLASNNLTGFIGEFGVPSNDPRWLQVLDRFLLAMEAHNLSGTAWGGGFWWSETYNLRLGGGKVGDSASFDLLKGYFDEADHNVGTSASDQLFGTTLVDIIKGGDGDDLIVGSPGGDSISGGGGFDTVTYASSTSAVQVDLKRGSQLGGFAAGDILGQIEHLVGSAYADTLRGDAAANQLSGGNGDDLLVGRGGADRLDGGGGVDMASYAESSVAVDVDLQRAAQLGGDAQGDLLAGIETVEGSAFGDKLQGSALDETLIGGLGNDWLQGRGGADTLDGGSGKDTVSYSESMSGVDVDFTRAVQLGGDAAGDILKSCENLGGSSFADTLAGDSAANIIDAGAGDDILIGRGGSDKLYGGGGNDRFVFDSAGNAKGDQVRDFAKGDVLDFTAMDANTLMSGDQAFSLIGSKAFSGTAGQLRVFHSSSAGLTYVSGDTNGDKIADFTVSLVGIHDLSGSGILL